MQFCLKKTAQIPENPTKNRFIPIQGGFTPEMDSFFQTRRARQTSTLNALQRLENDYIVCVFAPVHGQCLARRMDDTEGS